LKIALTMAAIAAAESVVMIWRIRSGVGKSGFSAGLAAFAVCVLRVLWAYTGIAAAWNEQFIEAGPSYCVTALVVTWLTHRAPKETR